jgi:hypothetical protein
MVHRLPVQSRNSTQLNHLRVITSSVLSIRSHSAKVAHKVVYSRQAVNNGSLHSIGFDVQYKTARCALEAFTMPFLNTTRQAAFTFR